MTTKPVTDAEVEAADLLYRAGLYADGTRRDLMRKVLENFAQSRAAEVVGAVPVTSIYKRLYGATIQVTAGHHAKHYDLNNGWLCLQYNTDSEALSAHKALRDLSVMAHKYLDAAPAQPKAPAPVRQGEAHPVSRADVDAAWLRFLKAKIAEHVAGRYAEKITPEQDAEVQRSYEAFSRCLDALCATPPGGASGGVQGRRLTTKPKCTFCDGTGLVDGSGFCDYENCEECGGSGSSTVGRGE